MMNVWQLNDNNDIGLDNSGNIAQLQNNDALNQSIGNTLQEWLGEALYNDNFGVDWLSYLNDPTLPTSLKKKQIQNQINIEYPQVEITSIVFNPDRIHRTMELSVEYLYNGEVNNVTVQQ